MAPRWLQSCAALRGLLHLQHRCAALRVVWPASELLGALRHRPPRRLVDAFMEYDEFFALSRRQYVPPNFAELRHILNIAQVGWGAGAVPSGTHSGAVPHPYGRQHVQQPPAGSAPVRQLPVWIDPCMPGVGGLHSSPALPSSVTVPCGLHALPAALQVHSSAQTLKLITFDADGTLYADGAHIEHDNEMIRHIISLMRRQAGPRCLPCLPD